MDAVEPAAADAAAPSASPQEIWDNMRIALPKLDAGAQKSALSCFPADFRLDFKAPCLFIASHSLGKCELRFDEALHITMAALSGTLHESFVHVGDLQCTASLLCSRFCALHQCIKCFHLPLDMRLIHARAYVRVHAYPHSSPYHDRVALEFLWPVHRPKTRRWHCSAASHQADYHLRVCWICC